jgi:endonuclease III
LVRGQGDRTIRLGSDRAWWTTRTPDGPATIGLRIVDGRLVGEAYGPGGGSALERVPRLVGIEPSDGIKAPVGALPEPRAPATSVSVVAPSAHPIVDRLRRRHPGVRIPRSEAVLDALIPAILEQKVTGFEARRAWQGLVRVHGEPAPGPDVLGLRLTPAAATLAALPYFRYHPFGIERRRADLIRAVAARAAWFEAIVDLPLEAAHARLRSVPGIGPWTAAEVAVRALGDRDAVSVGDFHLPSLVTWALAGEAKGTDARMLELLEPYRGERAVVVKLLELGAPGPARRGPRLSPRSIEGI